MKVLLIAGTYDSKMILIHAICKICQRRIVKFILEHLALASFALFIKFIYKIVLSILRSSFGLFIIIIYYYCLLLLFIIIV